MKQRLRRIGSELLIIGTVVVFTFAARSAIADHYYIPSESMERSLLVGDRVLVDKTVYGLRIPFTGIEVLRGRSPSRGEIVIFDSPESGDRLIKRVVAVAGDEVAVTGGRLTVNDEQLASGDTPDVEIFGERRAALNLDSGGGPDLDELLVPEGMVLVMGDNRGNSHDGRAFGLIPESDIYGRAARLYFRRNQGLVWKPL